MINKYITATVLAFVSSNVIKSQPQRFYPKLVVNITIDQLRTDYIEDFYPFYGENGIKKLLDNGAIYNNVQYTFFPVDRASAIASIMTGATPSKNGITGSKWLNKKSLFPVDCTDDIRYSSHPVPSPKNLLVTTINDELKISTEDKAIVFSIAKERDAAIISGGHAANGAFWYDQNSKQWCSSSYYSKKIPSWLESYNSLYANGFTDNNINSNITNVALQCIEAGGMGMDDVPDMLSLTYEAKIPENRSSLQLQNTYIQIDKELEKLISKTEKRLGKDNVLFIITSTGYCDEPKTDYSKYRIPCGTFYINRTANLLNMYLGAIYGQDKYVESCFYNQVFFNLKLIEQKRISMDEIQNRSQSFLMQNEGVCNVFTSKDLLLSKTDSNSKIKNWYNPGKCGDLIIEVSPGWQLLNEENQQQYTSRENLIFFPIIFYGAGITHTKITNPVTIERIAPTIAKNIRIRAPNACSATPLF